MKKPFSIKFTLFLNSFILFFTLAGLFKQIYSIPALLASNILASELAINTIIQFFFVMFFGFVLFGTIKIKPWGRLLVILFSISILIAHLYIMHNHVVPVKTEDLRATGAAQAIISILSISYIIYMITSKQVKLYFKCAGKIS